MHNLDRQRRWNSAQPPSTLVIGAGTLGSWIVECLHRAGWRDVLICDPDSVSDVNICSQNFGLQDCSQQKARVLADRYGFDAAPCKVQDLKGGQKKLVFAVTDNLESRKLAVDWVSDGGLLVDCRLGHDFIELYAVKAPFDTYLQEAHRLDDSQVADDEPCAKVSTICQSLMGASMAVESAVGWMNGKPYAEYRTMRVSDGTGIRKMHYWANRPVEQAV